MKILVLFNNVTSLDSGNPEDLLADEDSVKTASEIKNTLVELGYSAELFEVNESTVSQIPKLKPDLFFNQVYGIGNIPDSEGEFAAILEKTKIPFTGSGSKAIELTNSKLETKKLLIQNGISTPKIFKSDDEPKFPVIVKLSESHCSIGLSQKSVVKDKKELQEQIINLSKKYKSPFLIEEYIDGRELNVCILGNGKEAKVLPVSEILFSDSFKTKFKIIDFAAKWLETSIEYQSTLGADCPADLSDINLKMVQDEALKAFRLSGCRDYARVDVRLSEDGTPFVLEINANPGIGPEDGAIRSAKAAGLSYGDFLTRLLVLAMDKG